MTTKKKSSLSIDLGALETLASHLDRDADAQVIEQIPLDAIKPGRVQPRKRFDEETLKQLAETIRGQGVIEPIIVRKAERDGQYEIVAGERRWRASKMAGLKAIPAIVRSYTDREALAAALVENIDREGMELIDEILGIQQLAAESTQADIARLLGKSKVWVSKRLKIATAPESVLEVLRQDRSKDVEALYQLALLAEESPKKADALVERFLAGEEVSLRASVDAKRKPSAEASDEAEAGEAASPKRRKDGGKNDDSKGSNSEDVTELKATSFKRVEPRKYLVRTSNGYFLLDLSSTRGLPKGFDDGE